MIDAIVFDFDGVIVESADIKTGAFRRLFEERWPDRADEIVAYHLANEGISRYEKFRHIHGAILGIPITPEEEAELGERFSAVALEAILAAPFVPGALEFLEGNPPARPLFVASGTPERELHLILERRGIAHLLTEAHGTPRRKPEIVRDILSRYGLEPARVAFVGDAASDAAAAAETGLRFIARVVPGSDKDLDGAARIDDLTVLEGALAGL